MLCALLWRRRSEGLQNLSFAPERRVCSEVTSSFGLPLACCSVVTTSSWLMVVPDWLEGGTKVWSSFSDSLERRIKMTGAVMVASSEL